MRLNTTKFFSIILMLTFLFMKSIYAQVVDDRKLNDTITTTLTSGFNINVFKDSIAMYSSAIRIDVEMVKGKCVIKKLSANDSLVYKMFKNFDRLKSFDYSIVLRNRNSARIIIPVVILIASYENGPAKAKISINSIPKQILNMFDDVGNNKVDFPASQNIYLQPYYFMVSKIVYD